MALNISKLLGLLRHTGTLQKGL